VSSLADSSQLGFGAGLRAEHYQDVLDGTPAIDWFEAISENYMDSGGRPFDVLERVRRDHPVALHGVALSIGSVDELDRDYLSSLSRLIDRIQPALVTDHLCWCGMGGHPLYDLLPLPYTEESLNHVVERVSRVQDILGRQILLENPSTYVAFAHSTIDEPTFLAELATRADCRILLDVNNIYVTSHNLDLDPGAYIDSIPADRVGQFHLAGFTDMGTYLFDTHSAPVHEDVWDLYRRACRRFPDVPTLIEWDAEIPPLARLCEEVEHARRESEAAKQHADTETSSAAVHG